MNKNLERNRINEIRLEVVEIDSTLTWINRSIENPDREMPILELKILEKQLLKEKKKLELKAHSIESHIIGLGRYPIFDIYPIANRNQNRYSNVYGSISN